MPAKMHTFYLRNMYVRNLLSQPGELVVGGEHMDLSKVSTPACFVSTVEDHIAPWKSTHMGAKLLGGPVRFLLGGSGHIAGIVNPPEAKKYHYFTNDGLTADADTWLATARRHEGSWWDEWASWVHDFGDGKVAARKPGAGKLKVLDDAPGSYAKFRLDAVAADAATPTVQPAAVAPKVHAGPAVPVELPKPAPVTPTPVARATPAVPPVAKAPPRRVPPKPAPKPAAKAVTPAAPAGKKAVARGKAKAIEPRVPKPTVKAEAPAARVRKAAAKPKDKVIEPPVPVIAAPKAKAPAKPPARSAMKRAAQTATPAAKPAPAPKPAAKAKPPFARQKPAAPAPKAQAVAAAPVSVTAPTRPGGAAAAISALFRSQATTSPVAPPPSKAAKKAKSGKKAEKAKDKPAGRWRKG